MAPPANPVEPVHFSSGSSKLADVADYQGVDAAAGQLKANPRLYVVLTGFTDSDGREDSNLALSQSRAEYVADLLRAQGCDDRRIYARGLGELISTGENVQADRRVEFVFYAARSGELPTADQILQANGANSPSTLGTAQALQRVASAGGVESGLASASEPGSPATAATSEGDSNPKASKGSKGSKGSKKAPRERANMEVTGIQDLDSFFKKGQLLLDKLRRNQDSIAGCRASLETVLGVAEGADLESALAELKASAAGALTLKMEGMKPKIAVKPGASPKASAAVSSLNQLVDAMGKATADLATLPGDAMKLVNEAKALPGKVPNMAKVAGLKPMQIPKLLKSVKNNVSLLASVPSEAKGLIDESSSTFKLIQGMFKG